jgi:hypothetical protein
VEEGDNQGEKKKKKKKTAIKSSAEKKDTYAHTNKGRI